MSEEPPGAGRRRSSWLATTYAVVGAGIVGAYLWVALSGWEYERAARGVMPQSVRSSPGGYRSFHFWHSGFHGGK
ncbi:MAG TPA: hypothetical protein VK698_06570 [Kofleriaceae bacterium]|nr:hypothetical protein [Kofleriaceae bacterium]